MSTRGDTLKPLGIDRVYRLAEPVRRLRRLPRPEVEVVIPADGDAGAGDDDGADLGVDESPTGSEPGLVCQPMVRGTMRG